jgi:hypothetical protein
MDRSSSIVGILLREASDPPIDPARRRRARLTVARRSLALLVVVGGVAWAALSAYVPELAVCEQSFGSHGVRVTCHPAGANQLLPVAALTLLLLAPDIAELGIGGVTLRWRGRGRRRLPGGSSSTSSSADSSHLVR